MEALCSGWRRLDASIKLLLHERTQTLISSCGVNISEGFHRHLVFRGPYHDLQQAPLDLMDIEYLAVNPHPLNFLLHFFQILPQPLLSLELRPQKILPAPHLLLTIPENSLSKDRLSPDDFEVVSNVVMLVPVIGTVPYLFGPVNQTIRSEAARHLCSEKPDIDVPDGQGLQVLSRL